MKSIFRSLCVLFLLAGSAAHAADMPPSFQALAARVLPAVVSIAAMAPVGPGKQQPSGDDNGGDGGNGGDSSVFHPAADTPDNVAGTVLPPPKTIESLGSGFVFDPAGYILTNNHVVDGANAVTVTFADGSVYPATIAGRDKDADLAVLKIDAGHKVPYVSFGDSGKVRVGDWVLAVGNPFGLPGTSTAGIVSALHRDIQDTAFDDFIQTDAAINRGNSGGPLFNMEGEVIGVNSAIYAPSGTSDGVGFAIPSAMAEPVAEALAHTGAMNRGWLGVATEEITPDIQAALGLPGTNGALVGAVSSNGPSQGKLHPGDVVLALAGVDVIDPRALQIRTAEIPTGQTVKLKFWHNGGVDETNLTLTSPPPALDDTVPPPAPPGPITLAAYGLGLSGKPANGGVAVVSATGPAAKAGIAAGNLIEEVNGETVATAEDVRAKLKALAGSGNPAVLLISGGTGEGTNPGPRWVTVLAGN
jgi:S1-C subfamily serine protease